MSNFKIYKKGGKIYADYHGETVRIDTPLTVTELKPFVKKIEAALIRKISKKPKSSMKKKRDSMSKTRKSKRMKRIIVNPAQPVGVGIPGPALKQEQLLSTALALSKPKYEIPSMQTSNIQKQIEPPKEDELEKIKKKISKENKFAVIQPSGEVGYLAKDEAKEILEAKKKLDDIAKEIEEQDKRKLLKEKEVKEISENYDKLKLETENLRIETMGKEAKIKDLQSELESYVEELTRTKLGNEENKRTLDNLNNLIDETNEKLTNAELEFNNKKMELDKTIEEKNASLQELETKIQTLQREYTELEEKLQLATKELETVNISLNEAKAYQTLLTDNLAKEQNAFNKLRDELENMEQRKEKYKQHSKNVKPVISKLASINEDLSKTNEELVSKIEQNEIEIFTLSTKISRMIEADAKNKQIYENINSGIADDYRKKKKELEDAKKELNILKEKMNYNLTRIKKKNISKLPIISEENEDLISKIEQNEMEISELKTRIERMIEADAKNKQIYENINSGIADDYRKKKKELEDAKRELDSIKEQISTNEMILIDDKTKKLNEDLELKKSELKNINKNIASTKQTLETLENIVQKKATEMNLAEQSTQLQLQLEKLNDEINKKEDRINELERLKQEHESEIELSVNEIGIYKQKEIELKNNISLAQLQIDNLTQDLIALNEKYLNLSEESISKTKELENLNSLIVDKSNELDELKSRMSQFIVLSTVNMTYMNVALNDSQILRNQLLKVTNEKTRLEKQIEEQNNKFEELSASVNESNETKSNRIIDLEQQLDKLMSEKNKVIGEINNSENEIQRLKRENQELIKNKEDLLNAALQNQEKMQQMDTDLTTKYIQKRDQVNVQEKQINELKKQLNLSESELSNKKELERQLELKQKENESLQTRLDEIKKLNDENFNDLISKYAKRKADLETKENEIRELKNRLELYEKELSNKKELEQQLELKKQENDKLIKEKEELRTVALQNQSILQKEDEEFTEKYKKKREQVIAQEKQIEDLHNKIKEHEKSIIDLTNKTNEQKEYIDKKEKELIKSISEIDILKKSLKEKEPFANVVIQQMFTEIFAKQPKLNDDPKYTYDSYIEIIEYYANLFKTNLGSFIPKTPSSNNIKTKYDELINVVKQLDPESLRKVYSRLQQSGKGKMNFTNTNDGLYNFDIDDLMTKYNKNGFKGSYAIDQIKEIDFDPSEKSISFIMNTEPIAKKDGHWVAIYLNKDNLEYYDSFGDEPSERFMKEIKKILDKWSPTKALQFKINRIKYQRDNSNNCGYFAMKFLIDRYKGIHFKDATGFNKLSNAIKGEKEINAFKKNIHQFGKI